MLSIFLYEKQIGYTTGLEYYYCIVVKTVLYPSENGVLSKKSVEGDCYESFYVSHTMVADQYVELNVVTGQVAALKKNKGLYGIIQRLRQTAALAALS